MKAAAGESNGEGRSVFGAWGCLASIYRERGPRREVPTCYNLHLHEAILEFSCRFAKSEVCSPVATKVFRTVHTRIPFTAII